MLNSVPFWRLNVSLHQSKEDRSNTLVYDNRMDYVYLLLPEPVHFDNVTDPTYHWRQFHLGDYCMHVYVRLVVPTVVVLVAEGKFPVETLRVVLVGILLPFGTNNSRYLRDTYGRRTLSARSRRNFARRVGE